LNHALLAAKSLSYLAVGGSAEQFLFGGRPFLNFDVPLHDSEAHPAVLYSTCGLPQQHGDLFVWTRAKDVVIGRTPRADFRIKNWDFPDDPSTLNGRHSASKSFGEFSVWHFSQEFILGT
jgi:hypothetical protein